jgi:hydrogenase expression/formation protein HypC
MCLAIPGKIIEIHGGMAKVDMDGIVIEVNIMLIENLEVDDYVLVHTGFAIQRYDRSEAEETLRLLREVAGDVKL